MRPAADRFLRGGTSARKAGEDDHWGVTQLNRQVFIGALNEVRVVRDEVMHFSPDPLEPERLTCLDNFVRWLRELEPDAWPGWASAVRGGGLSSGPGRWR
ncbi:hypothetical protein [Saccharothrix hoggarensis]|uniref:Uncharacterized protein n=1 Tax=Saccharothrix hoggarensis TaxID=913853 RepID=A0ABW3QGK8_9PSEU